MTRAIVYLPPTDYARSAAACFAHLHARGYEFKGVVQDWKIARRMLNKGECTVAIVAHMSDLDPNRKPRIEVATQQLPEGGKWWDETTRIIRRDAY